MRWAVVLVLVCTVSTSARADPPLEAERLVGEAAAAGSIGGAVGLVAGIAGTLVVSGVDIAWRGHFDSENLGLLFTRGGAVGYVLGVPIAVYLVGQTGAQSCSGLGALAGSLLGAMPGLIASRSTFTDDAPMAGWKLALLFGGPIIGSVAGCNLQRRYVPEPIITHDSAGLAISFRF